MNVTVYCKKVFADVNKDFRWRGYPGLSAWAQGNPKVIMWAGGRVRGREGLRQGKLVWGVERGRGKEMQRLGGI